MIKVYPNFLKEEEAERLVEEIYNMDPSWFFHAYVKEGMYPAKYHTNTLAHRKLKKELNEGLVSSMQNGKFTYRFKRSTDHVEGCQCFECVFRQGSLDGAIKEFIAREMGYENPVLGENFISCYEPGDFLSTHGDKQKGGCAFILNLTKDWRPEYGGLLNIKQEENIYHTVAPSFNTLVIMDLGDGGRDHFVSEVTKYAPHARIAISGWYEDKKETEIEPYN